MTSATERLRELLDERGVEWDADDETLDDGSLSQVTYWNSNEIEWSADGRDEFLAFDAVQLITPAQAIAATLGRGNAGRYVGLRQGEYWERTENSDYYCGGCGWKVTDHDSYCPECGGALHKAALGSCNCTNGERTGTCHAEETDTWECVCDQAGRLGKRVTIHVIECSACGHTYEHINGSYEYCPRCGRRRAEVDDG